MGDALADNLKKSGSLDFHFVSDKKAEDGLKDGTYYMIISIPKDFSKNAATLMDENPKQMKLIYKTNPGTNYIASKMDESAMAKIEEVCVRTSNRNLCTDNLRPNRKKPAAEWLRRQMEPNR